MIKLATLKDTDTVFDITQQTIDAVYPSYYPAGAVDFFKKHHSRERIEKDIENKIVFLCIKDDETIGTVTIRDNEILRLFVSPQHQKKGYGRELLEFAENKVREEYSEIVIDASLPAKSIYLKRGYKEISYNKILTDNGDYLCYDVMVKECVK